MAVYIDGKLCKGCDLCIFYCPKNVFAMTDKVNQKGYTIMGVARPEDCSKCMICVKSCPDLAIQVE